MDYHLSLKADAKKWNRQIINFYWIAYGITVIAQAAAFYFTLENSPEKVSHFIQLNIIIENLLLVAILAVTEFLFWRFHRLSDYIVIASGIVFCFAIIFTANNLPGIHVTLSMPLFVSVFYFDMKKLIFSGATMLVLFVLCITVFPAQRIPPYEIVLIVGMMLGLTAIGVAILNRGVGILKHLEKSLMSERELLIQNIIMDRKSKLDVLTGLYNHGSFQDFLANLIEQYHKMQFPFHVALLDIDNFKKINDTYGHWVGDIVLKKVAAIIDGKLSPNDFAARYGGEEFAVIIAEKSQAQAAAMLEAIRLAIAEADYPEAQNAEIAVTISIGMREYFGESRELLFKRVDDCLYQAKRAGKNRLVVFGE